MVWKIEFLPEAAKELRKLDQTTAQRIATTLRRRVAERDDPRELAAPLKGGHAGLWRWRIGDYRVIGRVEDARITILIVRIGHRRDVYD